jgi:hypothetical protein
MNSRRAFLAQAGAIASGLALGSFAQGHGFRRRRGSCPPPCDRLPYAPYYRPLQDMGNINGSEYYYCHKCGSDTQPWVYMTVTDGTSNHYTCTQGYCDQSLNTNGICDSISFGFESLYCSTPFDQDPDQNGFISRGAMPQFYNGVALPLTGPGVTWTAQTERVHYQKDAQSPHRHAMLYDITFTLPNGTAITAHLGFQMKQGGTKPFKYGGQQHQYSHVIQLDQNSPYYYVHLIDEG